MLKFSIQSEMARRILILETSLKKAACYHYYTQFALVDFFLASL